MFAIRQAAVACARAFESASVALQQNTQHFEHLINPEALQDERGRFRVWAGNLGAFQKGHSSLDYRLRESPLLFENVIKFLQDLKTTIDETQAVLTGQRLPYDQQSRPIPDSDDDSSVNSSDIDSSDDEDEDDGFKTELEQRFADIVDINNNLYALSIRIRSPTLRSRALKAAAYRPVLDGKDLLEQYSSFDHSHTRQLIFDMRNSESEEANRANEYLITRIGNSITKRRQLFMYWRRHRAKLATVPSGDSEELTKPISKEEPRNLTEPVEPAQTSLQGAAMLEKAAPTEHNPRSLLSATTATQHHKSLDEAVETQSVTSVATTAKDIRGDSVELPRPPISGDKDFECPYCLTICPSRYGNYRAWKTHLLQDLAPYVCTYENCKDQDQLYRSRREWEAHESSHRRIFKCAEHSDLVFRTEDSFKDHFIHSHQVEHFMEAQLDAITRASAASSDDVRPCPICLLDRSLIPNMHSHLANHLERLATFALPRDVDISDDKSGNSNEASLGKSAMSTSEGSETLSLSDDDRISGSESDNQKSISKIQTGKKGIAEEDIERAALVEPHPPTQLSANLVTQLPDGRDTKIDFLMSSQRPSVERDEPAEITSVVPQQLLEPDQGDYSPAESASASPVNRVLPTHNVDGDTVCRISAFDQTLHAVFHLGLSPNLINESFAKLHAETQIRHGLEGVSRLGKHYRGHIQLSWSLVDTEFANGYSATFYIVPDTLSQPILFGFPYLLKPTVSLATWSYNLLPSRVQRIIHAGNLAPFMTETELEDLFSLYPGYISCHVPDQPIIDSQYAFVEFTDFRAAAEAVQKRNETSYPALPAMKLEIVSVDVSGLLMSGSRKPTDRNSTQTANLPDASSTDSGQTARIKFSNLAVDASPLELEMEFSGMHGFESFHFNSPDTRDQGYVVFNGYVDFSDLKAADNALNDFPKWKFPGLKLSMSGKALRFAEPPSDLHDTEAHEKALDRWAQIREKAAGRTERGLESQESETEDDSIQERVARIKARVAELTGTTRAEDANAKSGSTPVLTLSEIPTLTELYQRRKLAVLPSSYTPNDQLNEKVCIARLYITKLAVDVIVTNTSRLSTVQGGYLNTSIHNAAGPELQEECRNIGQCDVGDAKITNAYQLPCQKVIHAVVPPFKRGRPEGEHEALLERCYDRSLHLAVENNQKSIGFPTIGSGVYGLPFDQAAKIALRTVRRFLESQDGHLLEKVVFAVFSNAHEVAYQQLLPVFFPASTTVAGDGPSAATPNVQPELFALKSAPQSQVDPNAARLETQDSSNQSRGDLRTDTEPGPEPSFGEFCLKRQELRDAERDQIFKEHNAFRGGDEKEQKERNEALFAKLLAWNEVEKLFKQNPQQAYVTFIAQRNEREKQRAQAVSSLPAERSAIAESLAGSRMNNLLGELNDSLATINTSIQIFSEAITGIREIMRDLFAIRNSLFQLQAEINKAPLELMRSDLVLDITTFATALQKLIRRYLTLLRDSEYATDFQELWNDFNETVLIENGMSVAQSTSTFRNFLNLLLFVATGKPKQPSHASLLESISAFGHGGVAIRSQTSVQDTVDAMSKQSDNTVSNPPSTLEPYLENNPGTTELLATTLGAPPTRTRTEGVRTKATISWKSISTISESIAASPSTLKNTENNPSTGVSSSKDLSELIALIRCDITLLEADAIVNSTNKTLIPDGMLDRTITKAAGPRIFDDLMSLGGCEMGRAKISKAYNLPCRHVIHAVPPFGTLNSERIISTLASTYRNCLQVALDNGLRTIAFPILGRTRSACTREEVAQTAIGAVKDFLLGHPPSSFDRIIFCVFSWREETTYKNFLSEHFLPNEGRIAQDGNKGKQLDEDLGDLDDDLTLKGPSKALWVKNVPSFITSSSLTTTFASYGAVESATVLPHKNCGFVKFEALESAVSAKSELDSKQILPGTQPLQIDYTILPKTLQIDPVPSSGDGGQTREEMHKRTISQLRKFNVTQHLRFYEQELTAQSAFYKDIGNSESLELLRKEYTGWRDEQYQEQFHHHRESLEEQSRKIIEAYEAKPGFDSDVAVSELQALYRVEMSNLRDLWTSFLFTRKSKEESTDKPATPTRTRNEQDQTKGVPGTEEAKAMEGSDLSPDFTETSAPLSLQSQHTRITCPHCSTNPVGFRDEHHLRRHIDQAHAATKKVWVAVDSSPGKTLLAKCKQCASQKQYGSYYNAAAHLRRKHFKTKRGDKEDGMEPSMTYLKQNWMKEIEVPVSNSGMASEIKGEENDGEIFEPSGDKASIEGQPGSEASEEVLQSVNSPEKAVYASPRLKPYFHPQKAPLTSSQAERRTSYTGVETRPGATIEVGGSRRNRPYDLPKYTVRSPYDRASQQRSYGPWGQYASDDEGGNRRSSTRRSPALVTVSGRGGDRKYREEQFFSDSESEREDVRRHQRRRRRDSLESASTQSTAPSSVLPDTGSAHSFQSTQPNSGQQNPRVTGSRIVINQGPREIEAARRRRPVAIHHETGDRQGYPREQTQSQRQNAQLSRERAGQHQKDEAAPLVEEAARRRRTSLSNSEYPAPSEEYQDRYNPRFVATRVDEDRALYQERLEEELLREAAQERAKASRTLTGESSVNETVGSTTVGPALATHTPTQDAEPSRRTALEEHEDLYEHDFARVREERLEKNRRKSEHEQQQDPSKRRKWRRPPQ